MKVFVDANILIAVLNQEYPLFASAARVLSANGKNATVLYTSAVCLAIAFYFAQKKHGEKKAKEKIALLVSHLHFSNISPT